MPLPGLPMKLFEKTYIDHIQR